MIPMDMGKKLIGLSMLAALSKPLPAVALSFSDTQQHWGNRCIQRLATENILNGYPDGSFRPGNQLTRAEFAVLMLNRFPDVRVQTTEVPQFADVSSQHWAKNEIATAYQNEFLWAILTVPFAPIGPSPGLKP